MLTSR